MTGLGLSRHTGGLIVAVAMLVGCGRSQAPIGSPAGFQNATHLPTAGGATLAPLKRAKSSGYIYVANSSKVGSGATGEVLEYSIPSGGNVSPVNVISGSETQLTEVGGLVVDSNGEIYVVDIDTNQIVGFAPGSNGNVAPNVVISGQYTDLAHPINLAMDSSGNLWVANCASGCGEGSGAPSVLEFAAGSNGNVTPIRNIGGSQTELTQSNGVALDAAGDIYVSQVNSVVVFAPGANGNAEPKQLISGSETELNTPNSIAINTDGLYVSSCDGGYIERFAKDANGNVPPEAVIVGRKTTIRSCADGVWAGQGGGRIYGVTWENYPSVVAFRALSDGNVRPSVRIAGPNTQLVDPVAVFIPSK